MFAAMAVFLGGMFASTAVLVATYGQYQKWCDTVPDARMKTWHHFRHHALEPRMFGCHIPRSTEGRGYINHWVVGESGDGDVHYMLGQACEDCGFINPATGGVSVMTPETSYSPTPYERATRDNVLVWAAPEYYKNSRLRLARAISARTDPTLREQLLQEEEEALKRRDENAAKVTAALRAQIEKNRADEEWTRKMWDDVEVKEARHFEELLKRHRREEDVAYNNGVRGERHHILKTANAREEDMARQRTRNAMQKARADMLTQATKHRREEAEAREREEKFVSESDAYYQEVREKSRRERVVWHLRWKRADDKDELKRHQETIKARHASQPSSRTMKTVERKRFVESMQEEMEASPPQQTSLLLDMDALFWKRS